MHNLSSALNACRAQILTAHSLEEIDGQIHQVKILQDKVQGSDKQTIRIRGLALKILKEASEKKELFQTRSHLYGEVFLPQGPDPFTLLLKEISARHENLKAGCAHFERILAFTLKTRPGDQALTAFDIAHLKQFVDQLDKEVAQEHDLFKSAATLLHKIEQSVIHKSFLINQLAQSLDFNLPYSDWEFSDQIRLLAQAEQILRNPFEPNVQLTDLIGMMNAEPKICQLILKLDQEKTISPDKKDFWDNFSELERKAHKLAASREDGFQILQNCKLEGLKALLPKNGGFNESHLIIGSGPAGLIHGVTLALQGKKFNIIEKRSDQKVPRLNTVTFGKWDPKELKILMFLGALTFLQDRISFGHNRPYYTETALGDLEWALSQVLSSLCENQQIPIQYETHVESISKEGIILKNEQNQSLEEIHPDFVFATDGASGTTRQLLGISKIHLSKPTKLAFSIYQKDEQLSRSWWKMLSYRIVNAAKGALLILKVVFYALLTRQSIEQAASQSMDDGPCGLSRIPHHDYLLRIFRKSEQEVLENYENRIALLGEDIKNAEDAKKMPLENELNSLKQKMYKRLENRSKRLHGVLDFIHALFNPRGHKMKSLPMKHVQTYPVDVMVGKAEKSILKIGKTTFLLRGDASHTTDPYSGTGAKTAIEESLVDYYYLGQDQTLRESEMNQSIFEWGFTAYQNYMLDQAFKERLDYYQGTELPERFADCALQQGQITALERDLYLRFTARVQSEDSFSEEEMKNGQALKNKLMDLLDKCSLNALSSKERKKIRLAKKSISQGKSVYSSTLTKLLAKLTCERKDVGWLLQMVLHLQKF